MLAGGSTGRTVTSSLRRTMSYESMPTLQHGANNNRVLTGYTSRQPLAPQNGPPPQMLPVRQLAQRGGVNQSAR